MDEESVRVIKSQISQELEGLREELKAFRNEIGFAAKTLDIRVSLAEEIRDILPQIAC